MVGSSVQYDCEKKDETKPEEPLYTSLASPTERLYWIMLGENSQMKLRLRGFLLRAGLLRCVILQRKRLNVAEKFHET